MNDVDDLTEDSPYPDVIQHLTGLPELANTELVRLPLTGPDAVFTSIQGRQPGESTAPVDLADLISSIATVGVLQPVVVERLPDGGHRLVAGERRLRACRWGVTRYPEHGNFQWLPAIAVAGPLSEEVRRVWQLAENLARADLSPGELGHALLLQRSAVLASRLLRNNIPVPTEVMNDEDPVRRWRRLEQLGARSGKQIGAPWEEVLQRLGVQVGQRQARSLVAAFSAIPREISTEMDEAKVALSTRQAWLRLHQGRAEAAEGIWAALKAKGRPELLLAAVRAGTQNESLAPDDAIDQAEELHQAANAARRDALQRHPNDETETIDVDDPPGGDDGHGGPGTTDPSYMDVAELLRLLREAVATVHAGGHLKDFDRASLEMTLRELVGTRRPVAQASSPWPP